MENVDGGHVVAAGFSLTDLSGFELYARYVTLGGTLTRLDLDSYLSGTRRWPSGEHDIVSHALNQELRDRGIGFVVADSAAIDLR